MKICFVRHGETDWNLSERIQGTTDVPLNDTGRKQANEAANALLCGHWDRIYASNLSRAKETASIIAQINGLPEPTIDADLRESGFGMAEGITIKQYREALEYIKHSFEPEEAIIQRMLAAFERIASENPDGRVIAVSHGAVINALLSHISGGELGTGKTRLSNGCLTSISYSPASGAKILFCGLLPQECPAFD